MSHFKPDSVQKTKFIVVSGFVESPGFYHTKKFFIRTIRQIRIQKIFFSLKILLDFVKNSFNLLKSKKATV
jgi:hypothetical protein